MPSDAIEVLSDGADVDLVSAPEPATLDHSMPEGVVVHPDVDWGADDPSAVPGRQRQCVAVTKAGHRCTVPAIAGLVLCSAHAGRLDSSAGGHARAQKLRLVAEEAETRMVEARMGTRAVVASALREKHEELRATVHQLADRAAAGDRQCALALLPFMQGYKMRGEKE